MAIIREESFVKDGKTYTIRVVRIGDTFEAAGYDGNRLVTIVHKVADSTNFGFFKKFGVSYVPQLVDDVKNDFSNGWYEP